MLTVPAWPEFGIERTIAHACSVRHFVKHIPTEWDTARKVERDFYWGILCTLATDWVQKMMDDCRKQRDDARQSKLQPPEMIDVLTNYAQELLRAPFTSSKYQPHHHSHLCYR